MEIESNLRIGFRHKKVQDLICGSPPDYTTDYERHFITFEKYSRMPLAMRLQKEKLMKETMEDPTKAE